MMKKNITINYRDLSMGDKLLISQKYMVSKSDSIRELAIKTINNFYNDGVDRSDAPLDFYFTQNGKHYSVNKKVNYSGVVEEMRIYDKVQYDWTFREVKKFAKKNNLQTNEVHVIMPGLGGIGADIGGWVAGGIIAVFLQEVWTRIKNRKKVKKSQKNKKKRKNAK